jgi:hypothetical protein
MAAKRKKSENDDRSKFAKRADGVKASKGGAVKKK